jgi:hypothetical protein
VESRYLVRALIAAAALLAPDGAVAAAPGSYPPPDATGIAARPSDRSRELLDYRCANSLGVRQVTLFANGTVRLREGLGKEPRMRLGELGPVELEGYVRRLAAEDLSEVHDRQESTEGEWVEHCTLRLTLDDVPERVLSFGRYDSLPLQVAAVLRVADEVAAKTLETSELPVGYRARVGDVLRRADGVLFAVAGFTSDGHGIELQGVDQPLVVYVRPEDVPAQFEALVSRTMP